MCDINVNTYLWTKHRVIEIAQSGGFTRRRDTSNNATSRWIHISVQKTRRGFIPMKLVCRLVRHYIKKSRRCPGHKTRL